MPKIIARINKKTGVLTLTVDGVQGEQCPLVTKKLRDGLGMEAEPELLPEYYQQDQTNNQQQST